MLNNYQMKTMKRNSVNSNLYFSKYTLNDTQENNNTEFPYIKDTYTNENPINCCNNLKKTTNNEKSTQFDTRYKSKNVSSIKISCVFLYIAQKQDIKYQKNNIIRKLNIKNIINFNFIHFSTLLDCRTHSFAFLTFFNLRILFSDKDKYFKIVFRREGIIEEYIIFEI